MLRSYSAFPLVGLLFLAVFFGGRPTQEPPPQAPQPTVQRNGPMKEGVVEHKIRSAVVRANSPRPLAQALAAVREEYGWLIDYEDPPYASEPDLIDVTNPRWRASHPDAPGIKGIAGGSFESEYEEGGDFGSVPAREGVLRKIVADYNRSQNPGRFVIRPEGNGRFAIIGSAIKRGNREESVSPILDTHISIAPDHRSAGATVNAILKAVADKTSTKLILGTIPTNLLFQAQVMVEGNAVAARTLLIQALDATGRPLHWRLLYDPPTNTYVLNIAIASRLIQNTYGQKYSVPIDYSPSTRGK